VPEFDVFLQAPCSTVVLNRSARLPARGTELRRGYGLLDPATVRRSRADRRRMGAHDCMPDPAGAHDLGVTSYPRREGGPDR